MIFFLRFYLRLVRMSNAFTLGIVVIFIAAASWIAFLLEPDTFENGFNSLWWVMTTVTTVGYGDFYPHTVAGKCLGMFLYIFGIGIISLMISKVIDTFFVYQRKKEEGKLKFTRQNHFVMIDWSKHSELALQEILSTQPHAEVVLIDTLEKSPFTHERVHYVRGNPVHKQTFDQANLCQAKAVFIFADDVTATQTVIRDTSFIDGKTLLIASAIERYCSDVYTIAEVTDKENVQSFQHVKVDEFILGNDIISQLAVCSAINRGASRIFTQLLTRQDEEDLYEIRRRSGWLTYRHAFDDLLREGATLISDGTSLNINRRLDETIPEHARLFVICNKDIYRKLEQQPT